MALDRDNKAIHYIAGRAIAILERYSAHLWGPNTLTEAFTHPNQAYSLWRDYVDAGDQYIKDIDNINLPTSVAAAADKGQAWIGYYHQKAEYARYDHRESIGNTIQEMREKRELSVRQLAEIAGISYSNLSNIENGRYNVSIDILSRVCAALGCKLTIIEREE